MGDRRPVVAALIAAAVCACTPADTTIGSPTSPAQTRLTSSVPHNGIPTTTSTEPPPTATLGRSTTTDADVAATTAVDLVELADAEERRRITVDRHYPLPVDVNSSYAREHHDYPASDIFAACGAPILAPVTGVIVELNRTDAWDPAVNDPTTRGGLYVSVLGDDRVRYYMAHLQLIVGTVDVGERVKAGEQLGELGESGNASACHVHFGLSPMCDSGEWWVRRGVLWPWPYLDHWRVGISLSPVSEVDAWATAFDGVCLDKTLLPWNSS